jgi:hypothetical protein
VENFHNCYIKFVLDNYDEEANLSKHITRLENVCVAMLRVIGLMAHTERSPFG